MMEILRKIGMVLLACTGIGALYMLSRVRLVKPGKVGVVTNNYTGENEILQPGYHCLLSPFREYKGEVPGQNTKVFASEPIEVHTADNIAASAKINISYNVRNAVAATTGVVGNFQTALFNVIERVLSRIIRSKNYTFQKLSSLTPLQPEGERKAKVSDAAKVEGESKSQAPEAAESEFCELNNALHKGVNEECEEWGIEVDKIQLVKLKAVNPIIEEEIEKASARQFKANADLLAGLTAQQAAGIKATTDATVMETLAKARANAAITEAAGQAEALAKRTEAEVERMKAIVNGLKVPAETVLQRETEIEVAKEYSKVQQLALGVSAMGCMAVNRSLAAATAAASDAATAAARSGPVVA